MSPLSDAAPSGSKPPFIKPETKTTKKKKKPGRNSGHKGSSRKRPDDSAITSQKSHTLESCQGCGEQLGKSTSNRKRVVIDIQLPEEPEIVEHTMHQYWCATCRSMQEPVVTDAMPGFSIGVKTAVYTAFLHYYQGQSIAKIVTNLKILGLEITPGALVGSWKSLGKLYTPFYNRILDELRNTSGVLHADETGYRENGKRRWLWLFCTKNVALFAIRPLRSSVVVLEILGKQFEGILITDFWKPYLAVRARLRQWCVAHFLREFKKIEFRSGEPPPEYWSFKKKTTRLFKDALSFSKRKKTTKQERHAAQKRFLKRLDGIVAGSYSDKDVLRLVKRLETYREGFFTFVAEKDADATNNHAERTLRFAVINRKVQFHTMSASGSATMEIMMSVFKTFDLQGADVYRAALELAKSGIIRKKQRKNRSAA